MDELAGFSSDEDDAGPWRGWKRGRKRDLAHISQSTLSRGEQNNKKKRAKSLPVQRLSSQSAKATMMKQNPRMPPDAPQRSSDANITSIAPVRETPETLEEMGRQSTMRHRESMGDSTGTSTSTSNNHKYMPSNTATGTTGTTEIMSNVQFKRQADDGGDAMVVDDVRVEDPDPETLPCVRPATFPKSLPRKKKRRHVPASLHSSFNRRSFIMDVDTPFFAVLEALEPLSCREDHRHTILFPHDRNAHDHTIIAQAARILELPSISLFGVWVAELRQIDASATVTTEEITSLGSSILSLRHHSHAKVSSLKRYHQESIDLDTLAVSAIHPQWTRQAQIDSQRICSAVEINHKHGDNKFFISSVSLAGFEGFTCSADLNMNASKMSSSILEGVEQGRASRTKQTGCPALLGIAGMTRPVGVSVLCDLEMSCDYTIWIGQDMTLQSSPIVAIDVTFSDPKKKLTGQSDRNGVCVSASPNSSMSARDSNEDEAIQELSELNLRAHTQSVGLTGYDPFERLWKNNSNNDTKKKAKKNMDVHPIGKTLPALDMKNEATVDNTIQRKEQKPRSVTLVSPDNFGSFRMSPDTPMMKSSTLKEWERSKNIETNLRFQEYIGAADGTVQEIAAKRKKQADKTSMIELEAILLSHLSTTEGSNFKKASSQGTGPDHQPFEKRKSVAEFLREQLPPAHPLQRSHSDDTELRTVEARRHVALPLTIEKPFVRSDDEDTKESAIGTTKGAVTRGRRSGTTSRSSFNLLVFATWSLLTWKSAIAPKALVGMTSNTMGMSTGSTLPSLLWKTEQQSHVFPRKNVPVL